MNRRDLFRGLGFVVAGSVIADIYRKDEAVSTLTRPWRAPRDTDDPYYDYLLDEMMGEEWS